MTIRVIADEQIPLLNKLFTKDVQLECVQHPLITPLKIAEADAVIVRSHTKIGISFIQDSKVTAVASPTSGADHLDELALRAHNVTCMTAPGCNSPAVTQYVLSTIAHFCQLGKIDDSHLRVGIIGVGHVGKSIVFQLEKLGATVVTCDPLRRRDDRNFKHVDLDDIADCDVLSLHTPLTRQGAFPTYHMINEALIKRQKPGCIVINTSRGDVLDPNAIVSLHKEVLFVLDVFPDEPNIDPRLIECATLATPHIAGHALESKWRGSIMIAQALCEHFDLSKENLQSFTKPDILTPPLGKTWIDKILQVYHPMNDHRLLQTAVEQTQQPLSIFFQRLRSEYAKRHEWLPY